ncbi:hypothetical protein ACLOJK_024370, partial [Asimina triloba]
VNLDVKVEKVEEGFAKDEDEKTLITQAKSFESIETEEIDLGTNWNWGAPLQSSGLAINGEAMGTTKP